MTSGVPEARLIGRYALYGELAAGGMATVHFGRLIGPSGFARTVAIKRLHPQYAKDPEFAAMFMDEARLAARIQHPNVVATLDVVQLEDELFLVMEYVQGEPLSRLVRAVNRCQELIPPRIATAVISGVLHGLHAAHEAKSERGEPLGIVHRDVSPQNIIVGSDGVGRVLDFGVAKAAMRAQTTRDGEMKGKVSYMAPEQIRGKPVDRRTDVFAAGVVLWEALTSKRLLDGADPGEVVGLLLESTLPPPSSVVPTLSKALDVTVMRALARDPDQRFQTARDFAIALEHAGVAVPREVGDWVQQIGGETLSRRADRLAEIESISAISNVTTTLSSQVLPASIGTPADVSASQLTPHSMTSSPALEKNPRAGRRVLFGVAAAVVLMVLVLVARMGPGTDESRASARSGVGNSAPLVPGPRPVARRTSPPAAKPSGSIAAPAPRQAAPRPAPASSVRRARGNRPDEASKAAAPRRNCSSPTYMDAKGIRRVKPRCL